MDKLGISIHKLSTNKITNIFSIDHFVENDMLYTFFTQPKYSFFPQQKIDTLPLINAHLSTVSTIPITTTTKLNKGKEKS